MSHIHTSRGARAFFTTAKLKALAGGLLMVITPTAPSFELDNAH